MASNDPLEKVKYIYLHGQEDKNKQPSVCILRAEILVPLAEAKHLACFWTVFDQFQMPGCTWFLRKKNDSRPPRVLAVTACFAKVKCKLPRRVHPI